MSIYLIRHGQTLLNHARVLQRGDTPLSETGRAQAEAVAERLAPLRINRLLSSDMARARETAGLIGTRLGLTVIESPLLRERDFGAWCGKSYEEVNFDPFNESLSPPNGETVAQFRARVAQALAWIFEQRAETGANIGVISHGLVVREVAACAAIDAALATSLAVQSSAELARTPHLANTAVSVFDAHPPLRMTLFGCDRHLASIGEITASGGVA